MIVTFFNKKGGVGKTTLAFNVAKDLDFFLLSNDDSVIESIYPNKAKIMSNIKLLDNANIIYDLGGFIDKNNVEILEKSDIIFIPTLLDINSVQRTLNTIKEIKEINKDANIKLIINQFNTLKKYESVVKQYEKTNLKIFFIPKSEAFINSMFKGQTIKEQYEVNNFTKKTFHNVYTSYKLILEEIKNV